MSGISASGKVVDTGDQVNVQGRVVSISGTGPTATVTVAPLNGGATFTAQARDMYAPATGGPAISADGQAFDVGAQVTVMGRVSSVSGSGGQATLTLTLNNSQTTATAPSTSAHSSHSH